MIPVKNLDLVPVLDWNVYCTRPSEFVSDLRNALHMTGFIILDNHPMNPEKIIKGQDAFKNFFNLPNPLKGKYSFPETGYQIGYTPFGVEKGVGAAKADPKEFFHVYPPEMFPVPELSYFQPSVNILWEEFFAFANLFMEAVALSINQPEDFFHQSKSGDIGYSIVRGLHYPAQEKPYQGGRKVVKAGNIANMCAWEHQDINAFTFLLADEEGLQLLHEKDGKKTWIPVTTTRKNQIIINCGDMMEPLTNGYYPSVVHRVICKKKIRRYSIPFFFHFPDNFSIRPLSQFGPPNPRYKYNTAKEYLDVRLREIGLKK